jgi:uncharacterized protein (TIGR02147 family)
MTIPLSHSSVFDFDDYKLFLKTWIRELPKHGHGFKQQLARALDCQTAYISQVLLGHNHLSLEQAEKAALFMKLSEDEVDFFLLLVQLARAGTPSLSKRLTKQIQVIRKKREQLKERVRVDFQLDPQTQTHYYSNWIYTAIHAALSIPALQTKERLHESFSASPAAIDAALEFLLQNKIIFLEGGRLKANSVRMHLGHDSPSINQHHTNWRMQAINSLEDRREEALHYSSVVTLSEMDAVKIKEKLMASIGSVKEIIKSSPEEELYCLNFDFFKPRRR